MFGFFSSIFGGPIRAFKSFIKAAFNAERQVIVGKLRNVAENTVRELEGVNMGNEEKRRKAFNKIKEHTKLEGEDIKDTLINTAIEMAILSIRKEL